MRNTLVTILTAVAILIPACSKVEPKPPTTSRVSPPGTTQGASGTTAPGASGAAAGGSTAPAPAPAASGTSSSQPRKALGDLGPVSGPDSNSALIEIAGITAPKPAEWIWQQPTMQFRNLQYSVPAPDGKGEPAELIISAFVGDDGGPLEPNITRWVNQFRNADDTPVTPVRSEIEVNGMKIALIELKGKYFGMGAAASRPGTAQLAAIIQAPEARVFIRLLGVETTVEAARPAWDKLVAGVAKK